MKNLKKLFPYCKSYKFWTILGSSLVFLEVIMDLFSPIIMANIVNRGIGERDFSYIVFCMVSLFILTIMGVLGGIFSTYFTAKVTNFISCDLRNDLFEKISKLSFVQLDQIQIGHIITVVTNDVLLIGDIFMMGIRIVLRVPIILIGSLLMAIVVSPKLSILLLFIIPVMTIFIGFIIKKALPYFDLIQNTTDQINSIVRDNIKGIRVVKSFNKENKEVKRFEQVNQKLFQINLKAMRIMTIAMPVMMLLINVTIVVTLWWGGIDFVNQNIEIGNILAFIQYISNILSAIMMASLILVMFTKGEVSASRINQILDQQIDNPKGKDCDWIQGQIEFSHVNFKYQEGSGDFVLKKLDFVMNPGNFIGIVGGIGSGKSTLVQLIPRFYEATDGNILVDGKPITQYDVAYLREKVGICMQKSYLYSGTIADYITKSAYFDYEKIEEVLEVACAKEFVEKQPSGVLERIEPQGSNFSGGEKQRLALARVLYQNPDILILDDALSAVDYKTEKRILNNLKKYRSNKTLIMVSSRITSIQNANQIVVLDDGNIIGIGTHEELLKENFVYQQIYNSQIEGNDIYV